MLVYVAGWASTNVHEARTQGEDEYWKMSAVDVASPAYNSVFVKTYGDNSDGLNAWLDACRNAALLEYAEEMSMEEDTPIDTSSAEWRAVELQPWQTEHGFRAWECVHEGAVCATLVVSSTENGKI